MYPQADGVCHEICARRAELFSNNFVKSSWKNYTSLRNKYQDLLGLDELPWFSIRDVYVSCHSHGVPLPDSVTHEDIYELNALSGHLWGRAFNDFRLNHLGIGRFLNELLHDINYVGDKGEGYRLLMYTGHDSTVVPILCAFGAFDSKSTHPAMARHS